MEDQFVLSDLQIFQALNDESTSEGVIKTEEIKDEDILLFNQLDEITNSIENTNGDYRISQEVVDVQDQPGPSNSLPQLFHGDSQNNDLLLQEVNNKLPFDLRNLFQVQGIKNEINNPHYVKYKLQDGKHVKIWECGVCGREFGHQYTLMRHLPTHTDERKFQCKTCGKAFRQMSTLSQHRAIHSSQRPYICEICQKTFNRVSTLISHRKTHTGLKPHQCHMCNKAFHQKGNLRNHIFTHTNERPYKCDVCDKGFNQMSNLMCHKLKAHHRAEKPKYVCQICGKDFPKRVSLRNHEQFQHGLNNQPAVPVADETLSNAILVDPIKTEAMRLAIESKQTPFALLRPLTGIPVLVRVLPAGEKQMLIPATAEDLKKHGQISITPKIAEEENKENEVLENKKPVGSTVQIKIPVVATVIQQSEQGGQLSMSVVSPGPNVQFLHEQSKNNSMADSYVFSSSLTENNSISGILQENN